MSAEKKERSHTEFAAAAEPLIKWLNANGHPMMAAGFPISAAGWKGQRFKKD